MVRTCKSIIQQEDEQDYIEIEEVIASTSQLRIGQDNGAVNSSTDDKKKADSMGQTLKKPKISLTWVLREQSHQSNSKTWNGPIPEKILNDKKKPRSRSRSRERTERLFSEKYLNENLTKELRSKSLSEEANKANSLCPHRKKSSDRKNVKVLKKSSCSNRFNENCCNNSNSSNDSIKNQDPYYNETGKLKSSLSHANLAVKNTYSEPSIYQSVSESGQMRRHRRRKRHRSPKFGYDIKNVDEFLSKVRRFHIGVQIQILTHF